MFKTTDEKAPVNRGIFTLKSFSGFLFSRIVKKVKKAPAVFLSAFILFFIPFSAPSFGGVSTVGPGELAYPNQRKIVFSPGKGYWVFYADSDVPSYKFSSDGSSWQGPWTIWTDGEAVGPDVTVWHDNVNDVIYVAAGPVNEDDTAAPGPLVYVKKSNALPSSGEITWYASDIVNMNETVPNSLQGAENVVMPNSVQVTRALDGYIWLVALCGEGSNGGNDDYIPCYRRSGSANSVTFTDGHNEVGTKLVDDEIGAWIWAVPDPVNPDSIICNSPQDNDVIPYNITSGLTETLIDAPGAVVGDKVINWDTSMSGVYDSNGNIHMVANNNVAGSEMTEYYRWYWDGSQWKISVKNIEIFAGTSYGSVLEYPREPQIHYLLFTNQPPVEYG